MVRLDASDGTAFVGAAIFSILTQYTTHAGSLSDARSAVPGDMAARQRVLDADVLTGGLVVLVGGTFALTTGRWEPLLMAVAGFLLVSVYYHAALAGPAITHPIAEGNVP